MLAGSRRDRVERRRGWVKTDASHTRRRSAEKREKEQGESATLRSEKCIGLKKEPFEAVANPQ